MSRIIASGAQPVRCVDCIELSATRTDATTERDGVPLCAECAEYRDHQARAAQPVTMSSPSPLGPTKPRKEW
mgnify:CR=1 FL=1